MSQFPFHRKGKLQSKKFFPDPFEKGIFLQRPLVFFPRRQHPFPRVSSNGPFLEAFLAIVFLLRFLGAKCSKSCPVEKNVLPWLWIRNFGIIFLSKKRKSVPALIRRKLLGIALFLNCLQKSPPPPFKGHKDSSFFLDSGLEDERKIDGFLESVFFESPVTFSIVWPSNTWPVFLFRPRIYCIIFSLSAFFAKKSSFFRKKGKSLGRIGQRNRAKTGIWSLFKRKYRTRPGLQVKKAPGEK